MSSFLTRTRALLLSPFVFAACTGHAPGAPQGEPNPNDACTSKPASEPPPGVGPTSSTASPIDLSAAVPNAIATFGVAAHGGSGDFVVGIADSKNAHHLARYLASGQLDASFGASGVVHLDVDARTSFRAFGVAPSGDVVAIGSRVAEQDPAVPYLQDDVAVRRFDARGTAKGDASILSFGHGTQAEVDDFAFTGDDKLVVAASVESPDPRAIPPTKLSYVVARIDAAGAFDASFGSGGQAAISGYDTRFAPPSIGVQPGGAIIFASQTGKYPCAQGMYCPPDTWFDITRLSPAGAPDTAFGSIATQPNAPDRVTFALVSPSGKLLGFGDHREKGAGDSTCDRLLLERRNADGSLDATFATNGDAVDDLGACETAFRASRDEHGGMLARQLDGGVVVAGSSGKDPALYRVDACGVRDGSFGASGLATVHIGPAFTPAGTPGASDGDGARFDAVAALPNGHLVATGTTYVACGDCTLTPKVFAVRVDPNGSASASR